MNPQPGVGVPVVADCVVAVGVHAERVVVVLEHRPDTDPDFAPQKRIHHLDFIFQIFEKKSMKKLPVPYEVP